MNMHPCMFLLSGYATETTSSCSGVIL